MVKLLNGNRIFCTKEFMSKIVSEQFRVSAGNLKHEKNLEYEGRILRSWKKVNLLE